tara:strand:+ start:4336 stop:4944 length:609 start_codon:yes stop_codon:yes gene_type:complete
MNPIKPRRIIALVVAVAASAANLAAEPLFTDSFTALDNVAERRAQRGDWQIADGIAKCTQDDALYKKYKDHGPIIFYDFPTTDATLRYAFRPRGCKTVVFTLNGERGHVFRLVTSEKGSNSRAFPPNGDRKSIATHVAPDWKLSDGQWTQVKVTIEGKTATVKFGDEDPIQVEHVTYAEPKRNFSVGFAFGELEVKDLTVSK